MALEYITDNMARNGVINTGLIDITGKHRRINDDTNIGLLVNAPNSHVVIDKLSLEQVWKGFEFRAAKSITVKEIAIEEFYNDGGHILSSNVEIGRVLSVSTILKPYSNRNHSDHIQIFNHVTGKVENISINEIEFYSRNHKQQANLHFTENHIYNMIFIGKYKFVVNSDPRKTYPYALSATNLRNSIIGGSKVDIGDLKIRVRDVKNSGIISPNNRFVGIDSKVIESAPTFRYSVQRTYPTNFKKKLYEDPIVTDELIYRQAMLAMQQKW